MYRLLSLKTDQHVVTPFYNKWNANAYTQVDAFEWKPWEIDAGSTSGAPVVFWGSGFVGLISTDDATIRWRPGELQIEADSSALFVHEGKVDKEVWQAYLDAIGYCASDAPYGRMPEYCTWVEQGWHCLQKGKIGGDAFSDAFSIDIIEQQLARIGESGWPNGRFTIDEGWTDRFGINGFGTWEPKAHIGDMHELASMIAEAGHVPGLWLSPVLIYKDCRLAQKYPELLGEPIEMGGECAWNHFNYLSDTPAGQALIQESFKKAYDWGFRKIKLDICYGKKRDMMAFSRSCFETACHIADDLELECHIPDPFCSTFAHVIRTNDVLIGPNHPDWRSVAEGHFEVCHTNSPAHMLNLDHIGGNLPTISEEDFIAHVELLKNQLHAGYPVVSLMPHHISDKAVHAVSELLNKNSHIQA